MGLCRGEELREPLEDALGQSMPEPAEFLAKVDENGFRAIAAFGDYRDFEVEVFLWSTGALTRDFLRRIAQYAFDELRVKYVRCRAAADMPEWMDQLERIGFTHCGRIPGGYDGEIDLHWYSITREDFAL